VTYSCRLAPPQRTHRARAPTTARRCRIRCADSAHPSVGNRRGRSALPTSTNTPEPCAAPPMPPHPPAYPGRRVCSSARRATRGQSAGRKTH
jgi:hypothetical protein